MLAVSSGAAGSVLPGRRRSLEAWLSIVLFVLVAGFYMGTLLGVLERDRRMMALAAVCLVLIVCTVVFFTPVNLPQWR